MDNSLAFDPFALLGALLLFHDIAPHCSCAAGMWMRRVVFQLSEGAIIVASDSI